MSTWLSPRLNRRKRLFQRKHGSLARVKGDGSATPHQSVWTDGVPLRNIKVGWKRVCIRIYKDCHHRPVESRSRPLGACPRHLTWSESQACKALHVLVDDLVGLVQLCNEQVPQCSILWCGTCRGNLLKFRTICCLLLPRLTGGHCVVQA